MPDGDGGAGRPYRDARVLELHQRPAHYARSRMGLGAPEPSRLPPDAEHDVRVGGPGTDERGLRAAAQLV